MMQQQPHNDQTQRVSVLQNAQCDIHGHRLTQVEKILERHQIVLDRLLGLEGKATIIVWLLGVICVAVVSGIVALYFKISP